MGCFLCPWLAMGDGMASSSSEREGGQVDLRLYKESANLAPSEVGVSPLFFGLESRLHT